MDYLKRRVVYQNYSEAFEVENWLERMPKLTFKEGWQVQVIPPSLGAIIRFVVLSDSGWVSVYLDAYNMLGCEDKPYWEVYDGEDCVRFYFEEHEDMMKHIESVLG